MSKDTDFVNFVTDDNTGGYFVMQCQGCDEVFNSKDCHGGGQIADTGDYGDSYCPHCGQVDPEECDNPNLVWNIQQRKINRLADTYQFLAAEYGKILHQAGFSESALAGQQDAMSWLSKRPAVDEEEPANGNSD
ncbi:hypothetical protein WH06_01900 [Aeromonas salmonicida subsp. salmonicida]|uniref:Uncharacterized protein n=2 Tax=Aeromonas salmonicida subsp. salmonicida TaxID=29491 RepID=A0A0A7KXQ6_AERSS|nr:hypothetical protein [Aeromonas salmonicida]AIZ49560.1 hypothetical protein [Aeromonas salmonicida subsp. salmonicida]AYO63729.1 hypothetical protein C5P03_13610 [Aeromonas salmonicida subsp. salmonicida 01-B526]EHI54310.1 hypothetical protein IYQ_00972 [Aeromonas salmonicida subsp. salmonicida 01-B526]OKA83844.1 hypothetical protein BHR40_03410 [Aeromonas salmonicida subsp. salmonicida]OSM53929.1 hypothetical protein WH06_01900 [Aeromonas salmonicida subsp. salmonicida]